MFYLSVPPLSSHSSVSPLPGVRALFWPQGPVPLRFSLPAPLRQQDLHVLLSPQQHRFQILLQRDRVPDGHAAQPHHHLRWIRSQVSSTKMLSAWQRVSLWECKTQRKHNGVTTPTPLKAVFLWDQNTTAIDQWEPAGYSPLPHRHRVPLTVSHLLTLFASVCWHRSTPTEAFTTTTGRIRCRKAAKWCPSVNVTTSMKNILGILTQKCGFMRSELYFSAESSMKATKERARCAAEALRRRF